MTLSDADFQRIQECFPAATRNGDQVQIPCDASFSHPSDAERPNQLAREFIQGLANLGFRASDVQMESNGFIAAISRMPKPADLEF
jgi:hypothetical protein